MQNFYKDPQAIASSFSCSVCCRTFFLSILPLIYHFHPTPSSSHLGLHRWLYSSCLLFSVFYDALTLWGLLAWERLPFSELALS